MLLVPFIGFVTGFGFAAFGVLIAAVAKTIDNFNYVTSAVLTPMFLVAGTFFPISTLPDGVRALAQVNPLYHCVQLVRDASLGDAAPRRPRPRGRAAGVRAADVAPGDLAARQAPDRLTGAARQRPAWPERSSPLRSTFSCFTRCSYTRRGCCGHELSTPARFGRRTHVRCGPGHPARGQLRATGRAAQRADPAPASPGAGAAARARGRALPVGAEQERLGKRLLQRGGALDELELARLPVRLGRPERRDDGRQAAAGVVGAVAVGARVRLPPAEHARAAGADGRGERRRSLRLGAPPLRTRGGLRARPGAGADADHGRDLAPQQPGRAARAVLCGGTVVRACVRSRTGARAGSCWRACAWAWASRRRCWWRWSSCRASCWRACSSRRTGGCARCASCWRGARRWCSSAVLGRCSWR